MQKRILIVNKFYYNRGGDCVASMNLEKLLASAGYEVAFFAMNYPQNIDSKYSNLFASQVDFAGGAASKLKAVMRTLGMGDIRKSFTAMLDEFHPDVVHLQNIHSYLSPVIAALAKSRGCRVVWTLHDYKLLCPAYSCLRDGKPCELCYTDISQVLRLRCMKGSLAASAVAYLEALKWNRKKLTKLTDAFVCPSQFMADKMKQGGFPADKLNVICNFVDPVKFDLLKSQPSVTPRRPYYCYIGRLSAEKGVATLLKAATSLPFELRIAGDGPLADSLKQQYAHCNNIRFLGRLEANEVTSLLAQATASVLPSECYENNPLGVIESLCAGTPVVGARMGGIPELINSTNGLTFDAGNVELLAKAISKAMQTPWNHQNIKEISTELFAPDRYLEKIQYLYGPI